MRYAWRDPAFRFLAFAAGGILLAGTLFYHYYEGWRLLDSLYFCVITLATVGYGDFSPKTDFGKIFTMIYILIGIGLLVSIFTRTAEALLAAQRDQMDRRSQEQKQ